MHDHLLSQNREYFRYKPEIDNQDYKTLQGMTSQFVDTHLGKNHTFEFCARYKGALTYYKDRFYCCGGTSAYLLKNIHSSEFP